MDLSTCPTVSAPEPRAARPALAGLWTRRALRPSVQPPQAAPIAPVTLAAGQALRLQAQAGQVLTVRSGRVWATLSGWSEDRWLDAGQSWTLPTGGRLVLEGSGAAACHVDLSSPRS
jgi:hypothetical protein